MSAIVNAQVDQRGTTMDNNEHDDEQENGLDPDWWIDENTTRGEYQQRTRQHAAKWRDDWH